KLTMMMIQCVLLSRLTDTSAVSSRWHTADHEARICTHPNKVEAVHEVLQISKRTQDLTIVGRPASWIISREPSVQVVETGSASHNELPRLDSGSCNGITSIPHRIIRSFIQFDRLIVAVFIVETLHSAHLLVTSLPYILPNDNRKNWSAGEIN